MLPIRHFGGAPARIVIAGGGVGGVEALLALRALARERVSIDLVAPTREFEYRPLSIVEPFGGGEAPRFNLAEIALDQGARHHFDGLAEVDADRQRVRTQAGAELRYDALIVAVGARAGEALPGAVTFKGPDDHRSFDELLADAESGVARRIAFAVPSGVAWTLPLYELALNTAAHLAARGVEGVELSLITPEDAPLGMFGERASGVIAGLLAESGVKVRTGVYPLAVGDGAIELVPEGRLEADRVVTLPRLEGPRIPGLPSDERGFVPIDDHCAVQGLSEVYAIGDMTSFPIKQGGITVEQAEVAAEAIASRAGAQVRPRPFRPVLRGLLLTGGQPRYLSARITRGPAIDSEVEVEPLWWPPSKIPGRYLASYLATRGKSLAVRHEVPDDAQTIPVAADLGAIAHPRSDA